MELDRGSFLEREREKNTAKPTHTAQSTSNIGYIQRQSTQSQTWASVSLEWRTLGLS